MGVNLSIAKVLASLRQGGLRYRYGMQTLDRALLLCPWIPTVRGSTLAAYAAPADLALPAQPGLANSVVDLHHNGIDQEPGQERAPTNPTARANHETVQVSRQGSWFLSFHDRIANVCARQPSQETTARFRSARSQPFMTLGAGSATAA